MTRRVRERFGLSIVEEIHFCGEITLEIKKEALKECLSFVKLDGYAVLMDLTAVDYVEKTKVVYWLHNPENFKRLRVVVYVARATDLPSVVDLWAGADWYEREVFDLFGVIFTDHPNLQRILLPEGWVGHPLQKEYALTEESVEFKHSVQPKIPSQVIPHVKK